MISSDIQPGKYIEHRFKTVDGVDSSIIVKLKTNDPYADFVVCDMLEYVNANGGSLEMDYVTQSVPRESGFVLWIQQLSELMLYGKAYRVMDVIYTIDGRINAKETVYPAVRVIPIGTRTRGGNAAPKTILLDYLNKESLLI